MLETDSKQSLLIILIPFSHNIKRKNHSGSNWKCRSRVKCHYVALKINTFALQQKHIAALNYRHGMDKAASINV